MLSCFPPTSVIGACLGLLQQPNSRMKPITNSLLCLAALAGTALAQNSTAGRNDTSACAALATLAPQQLANLTIEISAMQQAGLVINDSRCDG